MKKRRIESCLAWMEVKVLGSRTDCFYGFRNGTDVHGHTVLSEGIVTYRRDISGAILIISGASLLVSGANLVLRK